MSDTDVIPLHALDSEPSAPWRKFREQSPDGWVMPQGTYPATLEEVRVLRRHDNETHVLRFVLKTTAAGQYVPYARTLAKHGDHPYTLTAGQQKGLMTFLSSLGLHTPVPVEQGVNDLRQLVGEELTVRVRQTPIGCRVTKVTKGARVSVPARTADDRSYTPETEDAFKADEILRAGLQAAWHGYLGVAEGAYKLQKNEGWRLLGHTSLSSYLAQPEVGITRTKFYDLARVWEVYVVDGGMSPTELASASWTKLRVPLAAIERGRVTVEEAVGDANALGRDDLEDKYKADLSTRVDTPENDSEPHGVVVSQVFVRGLPDRLHVRIGRESTELDESGAKDLRDQCDAFLRAPRLSVVEGKAA